MPPSIGLPELERLVQALGGRVTVSLEFPFLAARSRQRDHLHARCVGYVGPRRIR